MAWSKSVTLWCDEDGCLQHTGNIPEPKIRPARSYASSELGWTYSRKDDEDYCVEHSIP